MKHIWKAAAATLVLGAAALTPSATAETPPLPAQRVSTTTNPDGTVTEVWSLNGQTTEFTAPPDVNAKLVDTSVTTLADGSQMGSTSVQVDDNKAAFAQATSQPTAAAKASSYDFAWCVGWQNFSGNDVHAKTCATRHYVDHGKDGNWKWFDRVKGSAYTNDSGCVDCDYLKAFSGTLTYGKGNIIPDWDPSATRNAGHCKTVDLSVSAFGTGASLSNKVCPDKFGPYRLANTRTGSKWWVTGGSPGKNEYRNNIFADAVHSPSKASAVTTLTQHVWWD